MKTLNRDVFEKTNKSYLFIMKYIISSFLVFFLSFLLLKFPSYSADGVKNGIDICMNNLIPGLYPFMILTNIYLSSQAAKRKMPFLEKLCRFLFGLPAGSAAVILFSFIGGLPIGAKMSYGLYERGVISKQQCARMICFCVNPGPAFVISVVGMGMLGSKKTGVIIYASLVLSSLIVGIISRFFASEDETYIKSPLLDKQTNNKGTLIENAVVKSSKSLLIICSWVVTFSCIGELIANMSLTDGMKNFLLCIFEVTKGSYVSSEQFPIPIVAAVIGFSGICGHFQVMGSITGAELKYKYFLVSRIINSGVSAVICSLLLKVFPIVNETFSVGIKPSVSKTSGSVFLSLLMILMAILFVVGDDYRVIREKTKKV